MDDNALDRLFSGDLDKLIPLPKRVVRLFISSTFTDMTLERNTLMERVYPRLKKYCREKYGLDFQVVDMRWGVRDEATDDHQTVSLCSREIDNCQRMSLGPNFVALLGDKYGFRPLCNRIRSVEYRALRRCLIELDINTDFMDTWYREDLNAVPAEYLLQPISTILKNFTNKAEPELQSIDQRIWMAIQERLHELLMIGSRRLVHQGKMSEQEQLMKYSISVTEREVIEGCLDLDDPRSNCLVYVRSISDLRVHLSKCLESLASGGDQQQSQQATNQQQQLSATPNGSSGVSSDGRDSPSTERKDSQARKASLRIGDDVISLATASLQNVAERRLEKNRKLIGKYIDLNSKDNVWRLDEEAQQALENLKEVKLTSKLKMNGRNLTQFEIKWNEQDGISLKSDEHKHYLNALTEHFYTNLTRMIRKANKGEQQFKSGLVGEILQHSHYARHVSKTFHGRSKELEIIRSYVTGDSVDLPMFIYGVGGAGKTSLLAQAATLARDWILRSRGCRASKFALEEERWDRKPCIVMRFCCTTPNSSSITGLLTSVCRQLQFNFYQFGPLNGTTTGELLEDNLERRSNADQLPYQTIPEDFVRLVFTFRQLLDNCQHQYHRKRLFLIILDSIERLSSAAESSIELKYSWLTSIVRLPPNVRLLVSCSSESSGEVRSEHFLYLKRHFLRINFEIRMRFKTGRESSSEIDHFQGNGQHDETNSSNRDDEEQVALARARFRTLQRLILPAFRLVTSMKRARAASISAGLVSRSCAESPENWPAVAANTRRSSAQCSPEPRDNQNQLLFSPLSDYTCSSLGLTNNLEQNEPTPPLVWILHLRPLGSGLALKVIQRWLNEADRSLTKQQWSIVEDSFSRCSRPIFVKLTFGELVNWKSYSVQGDSKGLTFGSAILESQQQGSSLLDLAVASDPTLSRLAETCEGSSLEADQGLLRWQTLSMEQQWLNYLEFVQRKQQRLVESKIEQTHGKEAIESSLIIHVGGQSSAGLSASSGLNSLPTSSICHLSSTIDDAICQLFARIELQHGYVLTKHSLSYITAARNGICENELEDILSLDDVVLDDVFQYHLPPVRRIPPLLWTRIRNDLPDYLSERDADGIVINWHHSQFEQVTCKRYLSNPNQALYIHSIMADYFLGCWADKPKPFRCTKQQIQMATEQLESAVQDSLRDSQTFGASTGHQRSSLSGGRLIGSTSGRSGASFSVRSRLRSSGQHDQRLQWMQAKADRRVPHQPLYYDTSLAVDNTRGQADEESRLSSAGKAAPAGAAAQSERRYNSRKLTELPYHLIKSGRFLDLANEVLFNYKWLHAALDALGLQSLLSDFNEAALGLEQALEELDSNPADSQPPVQEQARYQAMDIGGESGAILDNQEPPKEAADTLRSILSQLNILNSTVRLSSSAIHSDTQMLAPQLIGRLLPLIVTGDKTIDQTGDSALRSPKRDCNVNYLSQLVDQCDKDGCLDCALLPTSHNLPTADGLQLGSLEGHSFAIMAMSIAADQRHLLAVSNRFIMWDISTGEISRDLDPKIGGSIMRQLKMGVNNEFAISYSSENLILVLDLLTQQVAKFHPNKLNLSRNEQQISGLNLIDRFGASRFLVWTKCECFVLRVVNNELGGRKSPIITDSSISSSPSAPSQRIQIELDYSLRLDQFYDERVELLGVHSVQLEPARGENYLVKDLLVFEVKLIGDTQTIELITVEAQRTGSLRRWRFTSWKQRIRVRSSALDSVLNQMVVADSQGNVYLSRRRCASWSKLKLIKPSSQFEDEQQWIKSETNSPDEIDCNQFGPLAIELDSDRSSLDSLESAMLNNQLQQAELAKFERQIGTLMGDDLDDNEVVEDYALKLSTEQQVNEGGRRKGARKRQAILSSIPIPSPIESVILYYNDRITILRFGDQRKCEKNFVFPRAIKNVSVEKNRCQISSTIVERSKGEAPSYLVAANGRKLLIFSIESEQFLRSVDAHGARIVQLIPIRVANKESLNARDGLNSQLIVASASMDKTVKIWNLSNLGRDIYRLDKLQNAIEQISLAQQLPLAACLSRDQMAIWDWRTLKLLLRLSASDLSNLVANSTMQQKQKQRQTRTNQQRIIRCRLSSTGRHLSVATINSIYLLGLDIQTDDQSGKRASSKLSDLNSLACKLCFSSPLPLAGQVKKFKFFHQSSRLLTIIECNSTEKRQESLDSNQTSSNPTSGQSRESFGVHLMRRLVILCHSTPDGRLLYSIDCLTPTMQPPNEAHYLGGQQISGSNKRRQSASLDKISDCSGGSSTNCDSQSLNKSARLPVLTHDQLHIVTVECGNCWENKRMLANKRDERRKSSSLIKQPLMLCVYSAQDGQFSRSINLNELEVFQAPVQVGFSERPNQGRTRLQRDSIASSKPDSNLERTSQSSDLAPAAQGNRLQSSIGSEQFSRLKSINYRDRQSVVALMDDEKGLSFLIDVNTKQLLLRSNLWNGKVSSDGRYGLSRMFKSASLNSGPNLTAGGLQLLEMRRCTPIACLLSNETLANLSGSDAQIVCGITRPNDAYVYYHDSRLKRLLLIRLRDNQLIANYKLSSQIMRIKCSHDGYALVLGLADGSLTSLAIVDQQRNDSLLCLASYPSRLRG